MAIALFNSNVELSISVGHRRMGIADALAVPAQEPDSGILLAANSDKFSANPFGRLRKR